MLAEILQTVYVNADGTGIGKVKILMLTPACKPSIFTPNAQG